MPDRSHDDIPPLRSDVTWEPSPVPEDDSFRLFDALLSRQAKVTPLGRRIATYLDQPQSHEALLARLDADQVAISRPELEGVLDHFASLQLFESEAIDAISSRWQTMLQRFRQDPGHVPLLIPQDLRFECTCCGSCCCGVNVSPVTKDILAGLEGERCQALASNPRCQGEIFVSLTTDEASGEVVMCPSRNGRCIFVDADGLCDIHRRFGEHAKPHICRTFPFMFTLTPDGIEVSLQTECRDLPRAMQGTRLVDCEGALRDILSHAEVVVPPPFVSVDRMRRWSFETFRTLRSQVIDILAHSRQTGFVAAIEVLNGLSEGLSQSASSVPNTSELASRFYQLLMSIGQSLTSLRTPLSEAAGRFRLVTRNLDQVLDALAEAPLHMDVILASDEDGDAAPLSRLLLSASWQGRDVLTAPTILGGIGLLHLRWMLARALAIARGRQVNRTHLSGRDLMDAWAVVHMLFRNRSVRGILEGCIDEIETVMGLGLPTLVEARHSLVRLHPQNDLYLF